MKLQDLFEETTCRSILSVMGQQPTRVDAFTCKNRALHSLKGAPVEVDGIFDCSVNFLASCEGSPPYVGGSADYANNRITELDGAPAFIGRNFYCDGNRLTSLKGIHKIIKRIDGFANFNHNPIKSHVLGLLQIEELSSVYFSNKKVENILNKHLEGDRDIFACQEELIEAGFPEFAKL